MTMGREEAIKLLHEISDQCCETANILCTEDADKRCDALDIAIEALSEPTCKKCTNLINKEDAIDALDEFIKPFVGLIGDMGAAINGAREVIKDVPSADRPTGRWVGGQEYCKHLKEKTGERYAPTGLGKLIYCNQCWQASDRHSAYCPNCGARMLRKDSEV